MKIYCYSQSDITAYANKDIWVKAQFEKGPYWTRILSVNGDKCTLNRVSAEYTDHSAVALGALVNKVHNCKLDEFSIIKPVETMSTEELLDLFAGE